ANNLHVHLAPIDPAAVAARPHNQNGCRAIADDVRALAAAATCDTSSDCVGLPSSLVGGLPACELAINVGAQKPLQDLTAKWLQSCGPRGPDSWAPPHPATCLEGQCVLACADVTIPPCGKAC